MKIPFSKKFEPQKPLTIYDSQDITIVLLAKSLKPSQCDLSHLYQQGIIPAHWRLKQPVINKSYSFQVSFQEGLTIAVERGKLSFSYKSKLDDDFSFKNIILGVIKTYITDKIIKIQTIFRRLITLPSRKKTGLNFIKDNLLQLEDNQLKVKNIFPNKIQINFIYECLGFPFLISLIDTPVTKNQQTYSGLLFRGVINYDKKGRFNQGNELDHLNIIGVNLPHSLLFFNQIVDQHFL